VREILSFVAFFDSIGFLFFFALEEVCWRGWVMGGLVLFVWMGGRSEGGGWRCVGGGRGVWDVGVVGGRSGGRCVGRGIS